MYSLIVKVRSDDSDERQAYQIPTIKKYRDTDRIIGTPSEINRDKKLHFNFFVNPEDKKFVANEFFELISYSCAYHIVPNFSDAIDLYFS